MQARVNGQGGGHSDASGAKAFYRRLQQLYESFGERVIRSTPAFVVGGQLISALSNMDRDTRGIDERPPGGIGERGDVDLEVFGRWLDQQEKENGRGDGKGTAGEQGSGGIVAEQGQGDPEGEEVEEDEAEEDEVEVKEQGQTKVEAAKVEKPNADPLAVLVSGIPLLCW